METKDWGKTISYIRKNKNIPIKQVIGEKITRSAYSRFASGQTNTSIDNFFFFILFLSKHCLNILTRIQYFVNTFFYFLCKYF